MGRTLAAGTGVTLFVIAFVAFVANGDRVAGAAALAGLIFLSIALLVHVADPRNH